MDLTKAFEFLNHNLLLCNYGFNANGLTFIQGYFCNVNK